MPRTHPWSLLLVLAVLLPAAGCGRRQEQTLSNEGIVREVGDLYRMHWEQKKRAPIKAEDLRDYEPGGPTGFSALTSGTVVVLWGAKMSKTPEAANTVLGYEKDVPTKGGAVVMLDGSTKTMTADEFNAAPKAKKG
jgi:hypothetical protein